MFELPCDYFMDEYIPGFPEVEVTANDRINNRLTDYTGALLVALHTNLRSTLSNQTMKSRTTSSIREAFAPASQLKDPVSIRTFVICIAALGLLVLTVTFMDPQVNTTVEHRDRTITPHKNP